jgi:hypothetical protein
MKTDTATRVRRTDEQLIADLEARISGLKARAAQKRVKKSPTISHMVRAMKSLDAAMASSEDGATRRALDDARSTLTACLAIHGVLTPNGGTERRTRRSSEEKSQLAEVLLAHIRQNSGQRGEQIAAALGTDTASMRPAMHALIAEKKIKTKGERRGMTYHAA